ncbi:MFS transporter [Acidianus sp. RZ1]|uniref:MFS transporter n=1 Tax=Acidianus sp. RZ1 TaxID=1540082 RepID=UPI0020A504A4|nr:MFS transporter [Acidianus sp. RZ1]
MNKWFIVAISSASFFLSYFSRLTWSVVSTFSPFHPTVQEDGTVFSLFFVGYIIVQLPAGILADKIGTRTLLFFSLTGIGLSSLATGLAPNIEYEYLFSFLMGLSAGWVYPITVKMISSSFSGNNLGWAMGIYSIAWPLSIVLVGAILPVISIIIGWYSGYFLIFIISIILAFLSLKINMNSISKSNSFSIIISKNVLLVSLAGFLFFTSYWSIALYIYKYFVLITANPYISGVLYSLTALVGIFSTIIAGWFISKLGVRNTLSSFVAIYGFLILLLPLSYNPALLGVLSSLMGFVRFIITPANSAILATIGKENTGSVSGTANLIWQSSGIFASYFTAIVITNLGYSDLWIIMGIFTLLASIIYLGIKV